MKKVIKLNPAKAEEHHLFESSDLKTQIRQDAINDLESLCEDFKHMSLVVQSVQRNYSALLEQNQKLKTLLMSLVKDCYCWEGNRCERCEKILNAIAQNLAEKPSNPATKYQDILAQLRKLG